MNTALRPRLLQLRDSLPAPLASAASGAWRILRDWRLYRDGLLFDWIEREYRTEGMTFEIPRDQTQLRHRARFHNDTHELPERRLARRFIPSDACVLELGACLGVVSSVINRCLADPTQHVAVEPNSAILPVLYRNRARNGSRFSVEQALVSARSNGEFFVDDCPTMSSAQKRSTRRVQVPVVTVAELEEKYGLRFDALVLDIQGGEHEMLSDNGELLRRCRCVVLELHPHIIGAGRCDECREAMSAGGLKMAEREGLVEAWTRFDSRPARAGKVGREKNDRWNSSIWAPLALGAADLAIGRAF